MANKSAAGAADLRKCIEMLREIPIARMPLRRLQLREYFAAAALQGILTRGDNSMSTDEVARQAYNYADEMLRIYNADVPR